MELIFIFIIGLSIGSFLNVLVDRLPNEETILGRSHCDYCKKKLDWIDLIPVVSFLLLGARCRRCQKKLSWFYPFIELLTGVIFVLSYLSNLSYLPIICCLIVIFFADLKYHIIPDSMTAVFTFFSFILIILSGQPFFPHLATAFALAFFIYLFYFFSKGKGMGFGDVKLAFPIGLWLGPILGPAAIYFGFVTGGIFALVLLLLGKKKLKSKIAFGPFLVIGVVLAIIFQKQINQLYIEHFLELVLFLKGPN